MRQEIYTKGQFLPGLDLSMSPKTPANLLASDTSTNSPVALGPHRAMTPVNHDVYVCHRLAGHCWAPRSASRCQSATPQYVCLHGSTPNIGWSGVTDVDLKCRIRRTPVRSTSPQEKDKYGRQRLRRAVAPRSCCGVHAVSSLLGRDYDVSSTTDNTGDGFRCPPHKVDAVCSSAPSSLRSFLVYLAVCNRGIVKVLTSLWIGMNKWIK